MLAKRTLKIALMALAIVSSCAQANPNGPTVVNGSASFSQPNANTLNITTKTNKAIINWQGFNIGAGQTTNFHQPNRNSAVLNRVLSNSPSKIYGNLNSNGKVFLINQHGLMIGAGAKINTGGFFGSTLNITNEDFLNGNLKFEGGGFGGIINKGYIHAGPGGNVVLIAPDINNGGVIEVDDGKVILAAGKSIRITSLNDALIEFDVKSNDDNTIINLGDIVAKHGAVRLFAGSLKHSGSINANSLVQNADGSISLVANTTADITGELIAGGDQGGRITVEAETINVSGHALIKASGPAGGGTILIGGDRQGLNPDIRNATSTTVGPHARIHADATDSGDGGKVILFAERDVHVHGEVTARGGPHGGDGGFIETSGLQALDITRAPDASAASGAGGEWLIDPFNITIQDAGPDSGITGGPSPTPLVSNAPAVLTTATIETALNNGTSVTVTTGGTAGDLQGNGDITVADPIDKTAGGVAALTLNAHNNITVNAPISASGANALSITLLADSDSNTQGSINIAAPITTNNGDVILDATTSLDAGSITIGSDINAGAGDIDLRTSAGINAVLQSGVIIANALTSSTLTDLTVDRIAPTPVLDGLILDLNVDIINGSFLRAQNGLTLGGVNNASPTITLASTGNPTEFNIMNTTTIGGTGTILLADNFSNNNLFRPISGTMTIGAGITVSGRGEVGGTFGGTSTVNQGVINANSATGTLTLLEVTNNGTVNIANGSTLALDGVITTDDIGVLVNAGTGTINLVGDLDNTGNTLALTASTGDLTISFGSITNGTVTTAGGSALLAGFNSALDNVAINGDLTVGFGSTINLSNSVSVTNSLANSGDINVLTGSSFAVSGGGTQTGTFSIASGATLLLSGVAQTWTGASVPDASTGTLSVSTDLDLTGSGGLGTGVTLSVSAGTVGFGNNVPAVGTLNITSTGAVTSSSALAVTNDVTVNGSGASLTITGVGTGTLDVGGNLNLRQGTLDASGDISVTGPTIWNPLSTGSTETFTITGPGILVANGGFNLGTNLDANDQLVLDKFLFINSFSSWDDAGSGTLSIIGGGIILNNDFIQVNSIATGSAAQLDIAVPVTNIGEISKENGLGSLIFSAGLSVTGGDLNVSTGTTVEATGLILNGGELRGGGTLIGDLTSLGGVIDIEDPDGSPGTLSIIGAVSFLDQNSSIVFDIAGPADFDVLNITGDLNLAGGYMVALWDEQYAGNGSHTLITTTGTVNGGFTDEYLPAGTTGAGTAISVLPSSYSIALDTGGNVINFFTNALGGDWNTAGNWSAGTPQAGQYAVIAQDDDTIEVTVAANSAVAGIEAQNTIRINNGSTLTVSGANPNATLDYIFADVILEGAGVLSIDGTALLTDMTTLDSGNLSGTGLYINHPVGTLNIVGANGNNLTSSFDNNGVILNGFGPGTLTISAGGTLENFGKVQPGGPDSQGVLTFDGDFINRPTGVVEIEVAGPNGVPGDDHDQLVITGDANLFGTLALLPLGNFTANNGDSDIVAVTYGSFQNGFATIQPIDSESITPVYGANELTLQFAVSQLFTWAAAANGDWNTGINWDLGTVPTVGDDAIIGFGGLNITISANAGINTLSLAATNTLTLNSGTFTIAGDTSLDGGLNLAGGVLTGNGNLTLSNALNWTGGSIAGAGQLTTTAITTLNSGGTLGIGRDWLNTGTINHTNGVLQIQNGAFITNVGSYNANGGTQISANGGAGIEGFFNAGQFNVNADILVQPEVFDNDGTVTVGSGFVLSLGATGAGAAGNQTGTWDFADATISLLNNEWIISPGFTILSQPGAVLNLSGGTLTNSLGGLLTLPANVAVNLNNNSSVIQGNDDIQIDGAFNWSAGTLQGSGLLTTTGTSTVSSGGSLGTSKDWNNVGVIDHLAGQLQIQNGATITNNNIFNANGGSAITSNGGTGVELFNNAAGGRFTATSNISIQPEQFIQDGLLEIVGGATVSTNNADLTNTLNGVILATGTIDVGLGTLINDGTIHPGDVGNTGILTVLGNFTQSASGNLEIEIDDTGTQAGLDYDQLAVTSSAVPAVTLDGSLSVTLLNGDPLINDTFTLIDVSGGGSVAGFFANEFLPSGFDPIVYGPNFINTVFAVLSFFFDNDFGDFSWNSPTNWSTDVLPTSVDDVSISGFDVTIVDGADANTLSLASNDTLTITGGTFTLASNTTLAGNLVIDGGALNLNAGLTLNGNLDWTAGTVTGAGSNTLTNAAASLSTLVDPFAQAINWVNNGNMTWQPGNDVNLDFTLDAATFTNNGTFNIQNQNLQSTIVQVTASSFSNGIGGVVNSAPIGTNTLVEVPLTNSGTINVVNNEMILGFDSSNSGTIDVASGALFSAGNSALTLAAGTALTGVGSLQLLSGGELIVNTPVLIPNGMTMAVVGATLTNAGNLTIESALFLSDATIASSSGSLTFNPTAQVFLDGTSNTLNTDIINLGYTVWRSGDVFSESTFFNQGLFEIQNLTSAFYGGETGVFDNSGVLQITNSNTVDLAVFYADSGGTIDIGGGSSFGIGGPELILSTGLLTGDGIYNGDVTTTGGSINPGGVGAIGILSISGNYTQSGGRLEIDVFDGGTQAGVNYDQLAISGTGTWTNTTAALDFSYLNNGYVPSVGDAHTVVTCGGGCAAGADMGPITVPAGVTYLFNNSGTSYIATIDTVTFAWDGGGDGVDWFDANNWLFNVTPDASIDAVISAGNTVSIGGAIAAANSLTLGGNLNIVSDGTLIIQDSTIDLLVNPGGSLTVNVGDGGLQNNGDTAINGSLALSNGFLNLFGNTVVNGSYSQSGGDAGFTGPLTVNGSYNQSGGTAIFNGATNLPGSFSLGGTGVASFFNNVIASGSFAQTGGTSIFNVSTSALFSGSFAQSGGSSIFNGVVDFPGAVNLSGGLFSIDGFANLSNLNNNWSGGTISGSGSLVLGSVPGDTALAITGPAVKTLDFITLEMNQNDINMSGNGNLLLTNNAVIINDGNTFNHSGDGSIAGVGTLDNSGGTFNKFAGTGTIAVDLINDASSTINVAGGTLVIDDPGVGDSATYNVDSTGMLVFAQNRQLDGALNLNGTVVAGPLTATTSSTTTLTLPASLVYNGSILLNDANLDLSSLSGNTLVMNATSQLGGRGTVQGNIDNAAGVLTAGGDNTLGNLEVSGAYSHEPSAAVKVNILNDGVDILASLLTIDGVAQLDGGTLLIGYLDESITAVTADFIPIQFRGSVTGEFAQSIDADGSILLVEYAQNALTVLGSPIEIPDVPDSIVDDQVRFLDNLDTLNELISSNKSEAEAMIQELLDESEESGSLVCN